MKTAVKVWLIIAAALVVTGFAVFAVAMTMVNWDIGRLNNVKFVTNTVKIGEKFNGISIDLDTDDIIFKPSGDGTCRVVFYEREKQKHTAEVQNDTLEIKSADAREWFERFELFWHDSMKTTVYLPGSEYTLLLIKGGTGDVDLPKDLTFGSIDIKGSTGDVACSASAKDSANIDLSTGNISLNGAAFGETALTTSTGCIRADKLTCTGGLSVKVSTGMVLLTDVKCGSLYSRGSTGCAVLSDVISSGSFDLERSTGEITFNDCDASELHVKTSTGNVKGTLMTDKVFITETSTGRVSVPKTTDGGICEIKTSTGDIIIGVR